MKPLGFGNKEFHSYTYSVKTEAVPIFETASLNLNFSNNYSPSSVNSQLNSLVVFTWDNGSISFQFQKQVY